MEYMMYMIVMVMAVLTSVEISSLKKQVRALQVQLNALAQATGHEDLSAWYVTDEVKAQVRALKEDGKVVEAVKMVREATGLSLEDAKHFVDELWATAVARAAVFLLRGWVAARGASRYNGGRIV